MKTELTDRFLKSMTPPEAGRLEVSDTKRTGLRFRLTAAGKATWIFEKRLRDGPKRKFPLGTWPAVSLAAARKEALEIEAETARGIDRIAEAEKQRLSDEAAKAHRRSVREVLNTYAELHLSSLRTGEERRRQLETALADVMHTSIDELATATLQKAIDDKLAEGRAVYANRIRAALRAFTRWAWQRSYLTEDVGARIGKATKEQARDRVPSLDEVRTIFNTCDELGGLWGPLFKLLVLTGQRRSEIVELRWDEVDLERARIVKGGGETKNAKAHITHLSSPALNILAARVGERSGYVFTTTGETPVSGVSKAKARLDKLLGDDVAPWRIHDLRTALATALAEAGEPEGVVDRILNHSASGSAPSAVARVYQQSDLLPQRARALDHWANLITRDQADVLQLHSMES